MKRIKIIAVLVAVTIICFAGNAVYAEGEDVSAAIGNVTPNNIAIIEFNNDLSLENGVAYCYSFLQVKSGYTATIIVELQRLNSTWEMIEIWNIAGNTTATLDEKCRVSEDYSYRMKITYYAYNSSGKIAEAIVKYSDIVQ